MDPASHVILQWGGVGWGRGWGGVGWGSVLTYSVLQGLYQPISHTDLTYIGVFEKQVESTDMCRGLIKLLFLKSASQNVHTIEM